mgnify:CR=1 FL=1
MIQKCTVGWTIVIIIIMFLFFIFFRFVALQGEMVDPWCTHDAYIPVALPVPKGITLQEYPQELVCKLEDDPIFTGLVSRWSTPPIHEHEHINTLGSGKTYSFLTPFSLPISLLGGKKHTYFEKHSGVSGL